MKIAITGPESSGKTELAIALSGKLGWPYVPEAARWYLHKRNGSYSRSDLLEIAKLQYDWWMKTAQFSHSFICDSDMVVVAVWELEKFGSLSQDLSKLLDSIRFDCVLLCAPDLPWEYDPLRENPHDRDRLFERYKEVLEAHDIPFAIVSGQGDERLALAQQLIELRQ
ncbi:MAG: hypothetical protein RL226_1497 [Bacteroidota bacterium]|jgi:nicotinamide riboside kinase